MAQLPTDELHALLEAVQPLLKPSRKAKAPAAKSGGAGASSSKRKRRSKGDDSSEEEARDEEEAELEQERSLRPGKRRWALTEEGRRLMEEAYAHRQFPVAEVRERLCKQVGGRHTFATCSVRPTVTPI